MTFHGSIPSRPLAIDLFAAATGLAADPNQPIVPDRLQVSQRRHLWLVLTLDPKVGIGVFSGQGGSVAMSFGVNKPLGFPFAHEHPRWLG